MLVAETVIDPGVQSGAWSILTFLGGMFIPKLFEYLNNRLTLNKRLALLEKEVADCKEHREECKTLKVEHEALKKTVERIKKRANKHHPEEADDDTGDHAPLDQDR